MSVFDVDDILLSFAEVAIRKAKTIRYSSTFGVDLCLFS